MAIAVAVAVVHMVKAYYLNYSVFEFETAVPGTACLRDYHAIDFDFDSAAHTAAAVFV